MINGRAGEENRRLEEGALEKRAEEDDKMTVILKNLEHIIVKRN
jgi:hypothetical protein